MNLLEALPAIRKEVTDVHLLIVGEFYDDPAPYREAITRLGIQDCVTIVAEYVPKRTGASLFHSIGRGGASLQ